MSEHDPSQKEFGVKTVEESVVRIVFWLVMLWLGWNFVGGVALVFVGLFVRAIQFLGYPWGD